MMSLQHELIYLRTVQNSEGDWDKVENSKWQTGQESVWVLEEKFCWTNRKGPLVLRLLGVSFYLFDAIIRSCKSNFSRNNCPRVTYILLKGYQHLTERLLTVNRQSVDCWPSDVLHAILFSTKPKYSCWLTVGKLSANRLRTVGQLLAACQWRGAVLHNYLKYDTGHLWLSELSDFYVCIVMSKVHLLVLCKCLVMKRMQRTILVSLL